MQTALALPVEALRGALDGPVTMTNAVVVINTAIAVYVVANNTITTTNTVTANSVTLASAYRANVTTTTTS